MTATRITHRQERTEQPKRDPISWALFYKMDWFEKHQGVTLMIIAGLILLEAVFEQMFSPN